MSSSPQTDKKPHKPKEKWVCVGSLGAPHGVKGDIKVRSFTEKKDALAKFDILYLEPDYKATSLVVKFANKDGCVASVEGITTREQAIEAKGRKLFVKREQLPETQDDTFYITDLVGLKVVNSTGENVGLVKALQNFGAGDVLEISLHEPQKPIGRDAMVPFLEEYVPTVDIDEGFIVVNLDSWLASLKESSPSKGEG